MNSVASEALRRHDAEILMARGKDEIAASIAAQDLHKALCVFLLDPNLRIVLDILDPKAVEQARSALRLT